MVLLLQKSWFCCLCLTLGGFIVHMPALQGPFLWDDIYLVTRNPFIKSPLLFFETFRHYLFLDSYSTHYRPVQNISFMPDYFLWGDNPFGYHLSNVLWHVAAGLALFFLLRRLLSYWVAGNDCSISPQLAALVIAFLWAVHPVHSAAIDYISGRADSLAFFFACTGWLTVLRADDTHSLLTRILLYSAALLLGLLALCSRESALIWLALFGGHQLFLRPNSEKRRKLLILIGCVLLLVCYATLRHLPAPRERTLVGPDWPAAARAVLMLRALGDYGRLMIFPLNLHMERSVFDPNPIHDSQHWLANCEIEYLSLLGLGVLAALATGVMWRKRGRNLRALGAAWFFIAYLPTSNLINLNATVAEHWLYLPSVGFLIFLAGCALTLPRQWFGWITAAAALFAVALSVRSYQRSCDWSDAERFFQQTLSAGGMSGRAATNLALVYTKRGEYDRAEKLLRRVIQLSPEDPIARNNLTDALRHLGREAEAEKILLAANKETPNIKKDYPRTWVIPANLARLRHAQKNDDAALAILNQARKEYPEVWELISYQAELLRENKSPQAALELVQEFAHRNWWHYGAALALGRVLAEKGSVEPAVAALTWASQLDVHEVEGLNLIAQIRLRERRFAEAYQAQLQALSRQPDAPRQYLLLSDILEKMGRTAEAKETLVKVRHLQESAERNRVLID
jgi:tetratricopeptide (TPR) repeat protein